MSPAPGIVVDGLWRALCPSIDAILFSSHKAAARSRPQPGRLRAVTRSSRITHPIRNHNDLSPTSRCQVRRTHSSAAPINTESPIDATVPTPHKPSADLSKGRTAKSYEILRELRGQMGKGDAIRQNVRFIMQRVRKDREKADIFLYEALLAANWDTAGSVDELALILRAARESGILLSSNFYHDALRVLAIHPDYSLRAEILRDMSDNNIPLSTDGKISVALGYLRDGQLEMALDYLDEMLAQDATSIPSWVWDIFIYNLGSLGFVDESFRLLQGRLKTNDHAANSIRPVLWNFVLEECARHLHYEGTEFIWNRLVEANKLNPSDGTTLNVLNTAARHRDSALATQAIQHLSAKRIKFGLQHYEPLLDCYASAGDLENALRVLCIMNDAGLQTDPSSTRSLYIILKQSPELLSTGPEILHTLSKTYKDIPTSAMNVLIEALPNNKGASFPQAVEIYQSLRKLCRLGPNKRTFDLLREKATSAEEILFVVAELYMSGLRRDWSMYDALVYAYTLDNKLDDAFRTLEKITSQKGKTEEGTTEGKKRWIRQRTLFALLECCFKYADERAWWLIDEARGKGFEIGRERVLGWVELAKRMEAERARQQQQRAENESDVPGKLGEEEGVVA